MKKILFPKMYEIVFTVYVSFKEIFHILTTKTFITDIYIYP